MHVVGHHVARQDRGLHRILRCLVVVKLPIAPRVLLLVEVVLLHELIFCTIGILNLVVEFFETHLAVINGLCVVVYQAVLVFVVLIIAGQVLLRVAPLIQPVFHRLLIVSVLHLSDTFKLGLEAQFGATLALALGRLWSFAISF